MDSALNRFSVKVRRSISFIIVCMYCMFRANVE